MEEHAKAIFMRGVCAAHEGVSVLEDIHLSVAPASCVGIIGPNGAGKTTLLRLIKGLDRVSHGALRVLGKDPSEMRGRDRARIGYVAQKERIDAGAPISVFESALAGRYGRLGMLRRPGAEDRRIVSEALENVGLTALARRPAGRLSGGEQQRLSVARALAQEPELLLLDEPAASADPEAQRSLLSLIDGLHARGGMTILYVTHDLAALPDACTRLILLREGRIWRDGPRDLLLERDTLLELYAGRPHWHARTQPTNSHPHGDATE